MKDHDPVNHPSHYTSHPSGIECIEVTRHMGFNCGNAVKYLWRADLKGNAIEDLKKAAWYIADEIARREKEAAQSKPVWSNETTAMLSHEEATEFFDKVSEGLDLRNSAETLRQQSQAAVTGRIRKWPPE